MKPLKKKSGSNTEINERAPRHLYRGATPANGHRGLPYSELPRNMGNVSDDENELDAALTRLGASDRGPSSLGEILEIVNTDRIASHAR